ncbi:hypothetical protein C0Q57_08235 [Streptomyces albidoflavus]|uniref:hypothetical protein n=1 Tax=Streptomyces albidoflavus TaxID=1886 RepID=UPI0010207004|nr:hypothetical protein [Streptomyces albidoflavus]RZD70971.1 hypothetical protein C0Q57_08235 [Streptomyces albidoflavus]
MTTHHAPGPLDAASRPAQPAHTGPGEPDPVRSLAGPGAPGALYPGPGPSGDTATGSASGTGDSPAQGSGGPGTAAAPGGGGDPVKALMHRHRELCARAVDPLEIAAALEAHGMTDRTAAHFRHRDVFSLAEEMYARVPRHSSDRSAPPASAHAVPEPVAGAAAGPSRLLTLVLLPALPGALCAGLLAGLAQAPPGRARTLAVVAGVLAVLSAVQLCLRHGSLRSPRPAGVAVRLATLWLLGYAVLGDGLLDAAVRGGPDRLWPVDTATALGLALAMWPAVLCARLFTGGARRRLARSRGLGEFAAATRPLLLASLTCYLAALAGLLALAGAALGAPPALGGAGALGALLLLARLLLVHGHRAMPTVALATAAGVELTVLCSVLASRLPACGFLAVPAETLIEVCGAEAVPTLACAVAAFALLGRAVPALSRASAHTDPGTR